MREKIKDVFLQMENVKHIIMNVQKHLKMNVTIIYHKIVKRNAIGIQVAKKRIESVRTDSNGQYSGNSYCYKLKADDNDQVCILDEGNCKSVYRSCDKGNGDKTKCEGIKPLMDYFSYYAFNPTKYCSYSSSNCEQKTKNCNKYIKETGKDYCTSLVADNKSKKCVYDSDKDECREQYTSCSSYSSDDSVTTPKPEDCKKIDLSGAPYTKCEYEGNQCTEKQKDCNDIKDKETCNRYKYNFPKKYCLFLESNNTCVNSFETCEDYNTNTNQNDCELIQPHYSSYPDYSYTYKCIFNANDNSCKRQKITCEDYQGNNENECITITYNLDDKDKYSCKMIDGKCKKEYSFCSNYEGTDKAKCEAIRVDPHKCKFNTEDNECYEEDGTCNEYKGTDPYTCSYYYHSNDENKHCILVNGKCVEKEYYYYCSDYEGTNKDVCQSIIPVNGGTKKCVYTNKGCQEQNKVCEDARDESECTNDLVLDSNKKQCVFINNACKEQFKDCETYNKENSIEQEECESIILNYNSYGSNSYKYRCKYTAPTTNGGKGTCTQVERNCGDFDVELIRKQCSSITPTDYLKKCTYNSNDQSCSIKEKTCFEMSYYSNPSEEYCNKFTASSSNKICVAGINGCIEVEKEKNSNNSSFELKLSQMVFILLYLLF